MNYQSLVMATLVAVDAYEASSDVEEVFSSPLPLVHTWKAQMDRQSGCQNYHVFDHQAWKVN